MRGVWLQVLVAGGLLSAPRPSSGLQAAVGLEYDDNPFEAHPRRRAGWISRCYLDASAQILEGGRGSLQVKHQWGFKRFWRGEAAASPRGDVMASEVELEGVVQPHPRLVLSGSSVLKVKNVARISSEESYLHGGLRASTRGLLGRGFAAAVRYQRSGDDAREEGLADLALREAGVELSYSRHRQLQAHLGAARRWLDYGRPALVRGAAGQVFPAGKDQRDQEREVRVGLLFYQGMLVDAGYALVDNNSNSLGSSFWAHQVQLLLSRHLVWGLDGQLYLTAQQRRYEEVGPLPALGTTQDEYAQTLAFLKLSRQLTPVYGLSAQYSYSRNGNRRDTGFFRKRTYGLSLTVSI